MRASPIGLRGRLIALFTAALVPFAALLIYNASIEQQALIRASREDNGRLVRMVAMQQTRLIEGTHHLLIALSQTDALKGHDRAACRRYLRDLAARYSWYTIFGVANREGDVECDSADKPTDLNIADRPYFRRALATGEFTVGEFQIGRMSGMPSFSLAYPVIGEHQEVLAVVFASVRMREFERLLTATGLPPRAVLITADRNGTILSRYPDPGESIGRSIRHPGLRRAALNGETGSLESDGSDAVRRVYSYTALSATTGPQLFTAIGIPKDEIVAAARRELQHNLAALGALIVLAVGAVWIGTELVVLRYLRNLAQAASQVSEGRFDVRIEAGRAPAELRELGRAFARMADALSERDAARALVAAIVNFSTDAIVSKDLDGMVTSWNPGAESMFGYSAQEMVGRSIRTIIPPERQHEEDYLLERIAAGERVDHFETVRLAKGERRIDVSVSLSPIQNAAGEVVGASKVARDVTERRQTREALERANERLRTLSSRLLQSQEAERHSVAYELRDQICQALAAIKMNVQAAQNRAPSPHLAASLETADELLQRVRAFSELLRPPQLSELGVEAAVRAFVERRAAETGLRIALRADVGSRRLPEQLELACFRVVQEGIENVIRHAHAQNAWVDITLGQDELHVAVADDGCGFELEPAACGAGLSAVKERVALAGGKVEVVSSPELGTEIVATLPLAQSCSACPSDAPS
jgi:PAS domain S-box-containing protein